MYNNYKEHKVQENGINSLRDEIAPHTLITINGDIKDYAIGMELYYKYNVDGIMIGRGIFHNPFAFDKEGKHRDTQAYIDLFKHHLNLYDQYILDEPTLMKPLHRFFKIYIRDIPNASKLRRQLSDTKYTSEMRALIEAFEDGKLNDNEDI